MMNETWKWTYFYIMQCVQEEDYKAGYMETNCRWEQTIRKVHSITDTCAYTWQFGKLSKKGFIDDMAKYLKMCNLVCTVIQS